LFSSYNQLIGAVNGQFSVAPDGSSAHHLNRTVPSTVAVELADRHHLCDYGNDGFVNLASLGINLTNDGTLSVDTTKLTPAITQNSSALQNFFSRSIRQTKVLPKLLARLFHSDLPTQGS